MQITVGHKTLADQNLLVSNKIILVSLTINYYVGKPQQKLWDCLNMSFFMKLWCFLCSIVSHRQQKNTKLLKCNATSYLNICENRQLKTYSKVNLPKKHWFFDSQEFKFTCFHTLHLCNKKKRGFLHKTGYHDCAISFSCSF